MIIKHYGTVTETDTDAKGNTTTKETKQINDLSHIVTGRITWEGSRLQVARRLEFSYIMEPRDPNLTPYVISPGETVYGYNEDGNLQFEGNVYCIERNTQESTVTVTCYDHLFVLCRSKMTRKFTDMLAEDVAKAVCAELGVKVGNLAATGKKVSFVAQEKTGYQIIMIAYTEAAKQLNATKKKDDSDVLFHPIMNGAALDIVKKGELIPDFAADQYINVENSQYRESIEGLIDRVMVTDEQGNMTGYQTKDEWIKKYSMFQNVYKTNPNDNAQEQIEKLFHGPDRSGVLDLLGDYRVKSSYSIQIQDIITELSGKFWVKSDTHTFENGIHEMRLEIEFENIMNKEDLPEEPKANSGHGDGIGSGTMNVQAGINEEYAAWQGTTMPHGRNGCVEAATRIGSYYSPYLKSQYDAGVADVPSLVANAGSGNVIAFDEGNLAVGDCVVYGDNDHVVIYNGNGQYVGNNSSANGGAGAVGTGGIYNIGQTPTKIIKTSRI